MGISENLGFGVEALCKKKASAASEPFSKPFYATSNGKTSKKIKAPQLPGSLSIEEVGELT